jgi:hypothetical protein
MGNRITYIGLYAFSLYSLIMSLICGIILLLVVMLIMTLILYSPINFFMNSEFFTNIVKNTMVRVNDQIDYFKWEDDESEGEDQSFFLKNEVLHALVWRLATFLANKKKSILYTSNTRLEIAWTLLPVFILIIIMLPSLVLLYAMDDVSVIFGNVTIKVIGHQWYWSYQHVNMSHKLMPIFYEITSGAEIKPNWLKALKKFKF